MTPSLIEERSKAIEIRQVTQVLSGRGGERIEDAFKS
jgi:hypothetical protein